MRGGGGGESTRIYIMYIAGRIVAAIHMEFRRTKKNRSGLSYRSYSWTHGKKSNNISNKKKIYVAWSCQSS